MEKTLTQSVIVPIRFDTYLATIKNSVGANTFRNFFALVDGTRTDVMRNGELSCAWFASSILVISRLLKEPHATVPGMLPDLEASGWERIREPRTGCVLVWEGKTGETGETHRHVGFYLGEERAVSNSSKLGSPIEHHWTFGSETDNSHRKIEAMYWHSKLESDAN